MSHPMPGSEAEVQYADDSAFLVVVDSARKLVPTLCAVTRVVRQCFAEVALELNFGPQKTAAMA
eukprot:7902035-Alexandrium_andersonii.AAC.1